MFFNPLTLLRRKQKDAPQAHMTFAHTSASRAILRTGAILKRHIWLHPILAVIVLSAVGYSVSNAVRSTMRESFRSELQTLLNVETAMLETWMRDQAADAEAQANSRSVREAVEKLIAAAESPPTNPEEPSQSQLSAQLAKHLGPGMVSHDFTGFFVADRQMRILAATNTEHVGRAIPEYEKFLARALGGITTISPPFASVVTMKDESGRMRTGMPTMFVCAPVRDSEFQVVGALALRIRPEGEFTRILQLGRLGESGETYAFNNQGLMVSNSRFDENMIVIGLLPDVEGVQSILNVSLRDPGGNMLEGYRPKVRRSQLPLTKAIAAAVKGESGINIEGYRDYRGVPTVAAWNWLPEYEIGVTTKVDYDEAFRPLIIIQWMFAGIYTLLGLSSVAIFIFTLIVARMRREAQKAAIESKQLGQYVLDKKLGAGAMGVVYKGHHAMLKRPTAIKMLNVDLVNEVSIQRFEREVQITSQLNHPNTVAIYDYGRTPEGVFYYAMEYLDGIDLQQLVDRYGPQPEARVIKILTQMCGSLYEAHSQGLVHRDIKPANIMLNRRGGEPDLVKVLDFGLVKAIDDQKQASASTNGLTGTPLYMSPEAIQFPLSVDARSDIYAVGAVGYFLLTGQPVFSAQSLVELCRQHVTQVPEAPSAKLGRPVSPALEDAIMACLEKSGAKRPQTARDLAVMIAKAPTAHAWSIDEADGWWGRHERSQDAATASAENTSSAQKSSSNQTGATSSKTGSGTAPQSTAAQYDRTYIGNSTNE